ncbi:hypothetical protein M440DRAFT_1462969 [Trichoderma longibrachiatum ATCC 18648]|uniref:Peptidase S8/S53 domain-containing protein n=1 Tax=Trichoderma longibrachiatum ATCC 18648 TaxID=983965 RepID=A0A2T4C3M7_TRILO|nr:hypothetical protein M440DRAFT_1462969 [Trichoderma longibrachiatum ATCC 18648]
MAIILTQDFTDHFGKDNLSGIKLDDVLQSAIQSCLSQLTVERLDWQKVDLDLKDIYEAVLQWLESNPRANQYPLRDLSLRWSGNIGVLRSWTDKELLKFLRLERIYLFKPERHEILGNEACIEQAIKQFQDEIMDNLPLEVILKETNSHNRRISQPAPTPSDSSWVANVGTKLRQHLESAFEFSDPLRRDWSELSTLFREKSTSTAGDDVVVAVIGDGVDIMDEALQNRCLIGKSFNYQEFEEGDLTEGFMPSFVSGSDGTVMANLILQIYPIRLPNDGFWFDASSLGKGIEAALAKKATIIWVPRTMKVVPTRDIPGRERLNRALERARQENVLVFCSSDEPEVLEAYPEGVFFIDDDCKHADPRLRDSGQFFVFPGLDALLDAARPSMSDMCYVKGFTKRFADFKCESPSSVSTALATGLAAVIIYLVKLGVMSSHLHQDDRDSMASVEFAENAAETITRPEVMARVFPGLCSNAGTPDLGDVWHYFNESMRGWSLGRIGSRRRSLSAIAYQLILNHR